MKAAAVLAVSPTVGVVGASKVILLTGDADVCRDKGYIVTDSQRLANFCIVCAAERNNVPTLVSCTVLLDVGSLFRIISTHHFRTILGKCVTAKLLPVRKPAATLAGIGSRAIDVIYLHRFLLCCCLTRQLLVLSA